MDTVNIKKDERFLVFGYDNYYPSGGMGDMLGSFKSLELVKDFILSDPYPYHDVYDRVEGLDVDIDL